MWADTNGPGGFAPPARSLMWWMRGCAIALACFAMQTGAISSASAHPAGDPGTGAGPQHGAHDGAHDDANDDANDDARDDAYVDHARLDQLGAASPPAVALVVAPPIGEVLAAAYATARLDGDPVRSWTRRARLGGLVPWVSVRTGRNTRWQVVDPDIDHGVTLEVRATWRLDRLVFDGRELQASTIGAARQRERRRLASRVIRIYFAWQRAAQAARLQPRWSSRADEAAAELDALTDGWFSDAVLRVASRRTASETRTAGP